MQEVTENPNEWINWIEDAISKKHLKYYEYKHFNNIQEIGTEGFGKTFLVNWKKSEQYLSLKSFKNFDNPTVKELVHELKLRRDVDFHNNIIRFYGITSTSNQEDQSDKKKEYLLVTEYADSGSLQNYLKNNFNRLTWDDKYKLAYQLVGAVSCLHDEGIIHLDLHSKSISVHQNTIKLADFGLTKRIEEASKNRSKSFSNIPYIDPKRLAKQKYKLNEKSDVYSVGVLLWEISSGRPPFYNEGKAYDIGLIYEITQGAREDPVPNTPNAYIKIYTECWNEEPDDRPTMNEVVDQLISAKNAKNDQIDDQMNELDELRSLNISETNHSNFPSNDVNRIFTNGVVDCLNQRQRFKDDIVRPLSTIVSGVSGIINEIVNKNEERGMNNVHDKNNLEDYHKNNGIESQEVHDWLSDGRLNEASERASRICKNAENFLSNVVDAVEKKDHRKVMKIFKESAEGAMTNALQKGCDNDEQALEIVESLKAAKTAVQRSVQRSDSQRSVVRSDSQRSVVRSDSQRSVVQRSDSQRSAEQEEPCRIN